MRHEGIENFRGNVEPVKGRQGEAIDSRYAADLEQMLERNAREYEAQNPKVVEWIRNSVSRVDHTKLASIYQRIAERMGSLGRAIDIVSPERTFVLSKQKNIGAHSYITRTNTFNGDHFKALLQKYTPREAFAVLFDTICHENAHAAGFVDIQKATRGDVHVSGGYEEIRIVGKEVTSRRHLINEGIMELVGELAARMYLEESPIEFADGSRFTIEEYDTYVHKELMMGTDLTISEHSLGAREFVYRLAEHVARKSGSSSQDVVGRLISGFFHGGGFNSEPGSSFAEIVGPNFVRELEDVTTGNDLTRLAEKYNFPGLTPGIHQRMMEKLSTPVHGA